MANLAVRGFSMDLDPVCGSYQNVSHEAEIELRGAMFEE